MATVRICRNPPDSDAVTASSPGAETTNGTVGVPFFHTTMEGVLVEITVNPDNVVVYRKCVEETIESKIDVISVLDVISIIDPVDPVCEGTYTEYTSLFLAEDDSEACTS